MDRDVRAVFIGAIVSVVLSSIAMANHPNDCYVQVTNGKEAHVYIGHKLPKVERLK